MTLCKNKWHEESSNTIRHLNLSSTEYGDNDPAEQFTQGASTPCTGPHGAEISEAALNKLVPRL